MKLYQIPIGDDSGDGHGKFETFYIEANYSAQAMRQAYKDTCKKIGLQMNYNTDYTGVKDIPSWGNWRQLLTEYEQSRIDEQAVKILLEHGYDFAYCEGFDDEDKLIEDEISFDSEAVLHLFMWFISYSMPNDFIYKNFELKAEVINGGGWRNDGLGHQIGYGVFY